MPDDAVETTSPGTPIPVLSRPPSGSWSPSKVQAVLGIAVTLGTLFAGLVLTYTQVGTNTSKIEKVDQRQLRQERLLVFVCSEVTKNLPECQKALAGDDR